MSAPLTQIAQFAHKLTPISILFINLLISTNQQMNELLGEKEPPEKRASRQAGMTRMWMHGVKGL